MSQAAAAASAMGGGAGNNFMNPAMGAGNAAASLAMRQAMKARQKATAGTTAGASFGGAGMKQRFENLESRLDALEGEGKDPIQSVKPVQEFSTGGSFGSALPAPVATGTLNASQSPGTLDASQSPGSLQEAMPSPGDPAADMFGSEFMRNASVGAAKMRINKKI